MVPIWLILGLLPFIAFYVVVKHRYQQFKSCGIPGPATTVPFGNAKSSILKQRNIVYDIEDVYRAFKDVSPVASFFAMFSPYLVATDPALIKRMFITDFRKFRNNDFTVSHDKEPIIARNPFWMKDEAWKQKRQEVITAMSPAKQKAIYPLIVDATKSFVGFVKREIVKNPTKAFDSREICARYTCDSITSCTFGHDAKSFTDENPFFFENGRTMIRNMALSFQSYLPMKMLPPEIEQFFIQIAKEAIKCRTESAIKQDDFLTHTIQLREKYGMDDLDAASHCVTLFLDGFETTSVTLHQALYELGRDKRVQSKLRAEIMDAVDTDDGLSFEKLLELPYLNQVFYETLRLHPPLLYTTRVSSEDVEVEGYKGHKMTIKKDTTIWIPIPTIQRDPEYFPKPDEFYPERFDAEFGGVKAFKDRCVLIPFGDGPRICSGMRFAYVQVKAAIAEIVRNLEISVDPKMPKHESLHISSTEFMNVMNSKLWLNFKAL